MVEELWLNSPQMAITSNITNLNQPVSGRGTSSLGCISHTQLNLHSKLANLFCCISALPGEPVRQNNGRHILSLQQQRSQPTVRELVITLHTIRHKRLGKEVKEKLVSSALPVTHQPVSLFYFLRQGFIVFSFSLRLAAERVYHCNAKS